MTKELGIANVMEFASFQLSKRLGIIERMTPPFPRAESESGENWGIKDFSNPSLTQKKDAQIGADPAKILEYADQITSGSYRPFGGDLAPLDFAVAREPLQHWTRYGDHVEGRDIKWIWEPARFSWAFDLARAYLLSGNELYPKTFWDKFMEFQEQNPPNKGPNWTSAQEVALRIINWSAVFQVFQKSRYSSPANTEKLARAIWQHASRIPATLSYSRAQRNNHLLSESLGLIVAGSLFRDRSPIAKKWLQVGFREFNAALLDQIQGDGTYCQHSTNYHRLMLQLSLLYCGYAKLNHTPIPPEVQERLAAATLWMTAQLDRSSGRLPNLGHNDGSLLLPMGCDDFLDYRPTVQAASRAFLGTPHLPPGPWDELSLWLGLEATPKEKTRDDSPSPAVHRIGSDSCWATLRGASFHGRPAHADQLHLELWWDGINLVRDAGSFSYNDPPPWENSLASTSAHNTLTVRGQDQMIRAGKFLWLDQATARWKVPQDPKAISASHNGYRRMGITHERTVENPNPCEFRVTDKLEMRPSRAEHLVTLHWLLPDWSWTLEQGTLLLQDQNHEVRLSTSCSLQADSQVVLRPSLSLLRAGESLHGSSMNPILGWFSPTYGVKVPALSYLLQFQTRASILIQSSWKLTRTIPLMEK